MSKTIFISSTFEDLKPHRQGIWNLLEKFDVIIRGMERFGARTGTPLETCISEVEQSDIYIGIIAFRLGSIEPTTGKSYTQLEYEKAIELKKEVYIYFADERESKIEPIYIDKGEKYEKLELLKKTIKEKHTVDSYKSDVDLFEKI